MDDIDKTYYNIKKACGYHILQIHYTTYLNGKLNMFNAITFNMLDDAYNRKSMDNIAKEPGFLFFNDSEIGHKCIHAPKFELA